MNIDKKELYTIISSDEKSFSDFFNAFTTAYTSLKKEHLIIQFSENLNTTVEQISLFLDVADTQKSNGTSFAIVCNGIDIDAFPETFNIVPTFEEATDVLEMEAIERDLGF